MIRQLENIKELEKLKEGDDAILINKGQSSDSRYTILGVYDKIDSIDEHGNFLSLSCGFEIPYVLADINRGSEKKLLALLRREGERCSQIMNNLYTFPGITEIYLVE